MNISTKMEDITLKENKKDRIFNICDKISSFGSVAIFVISLLIFAALALQSLISTNYLNITSEDPSGIIFMYDNIYINLLITALVFLAGIFFLRKLMTRINPKIFGAVLLVYTFVLALIWNILAKASPAHDSYYVVMLAQDFANGDFTAITNPDYFNFYPFQLGYSFICEIFFKILGDNPFDTIFALQILNIIALVSINAAIIILTSLSFNSKSVTNFTIFLLFGCIQPILFTTFHYGNLLGFAFSMWAVVFTCLFIKSKRWFWIIPAAICIGIGALVKSNSLIILVAICIILVLDFLKTHSWLNLVSAALSVVLGLSLNPLVISSYENRADASLGDGVPKVLWLDMGLQETDNAQRPGWYNPSCTVHQYAYANYDSEKAAEVGCENISKRIAEFIKYPYDCADFFARKTISQWNDPTFMSVWVSATRPTTGTTGEFVDSMYNGTIGAATESYTNFYQSVIYVFTAVGVVLIIASRNIRKNILAVAIPLVFLGGFFYHLLFEAMPQYNLTYFILFIPLAAYGLSQLCDKYHQPITDFIKNRFSKKA